MASSVLGGSSLCPAPDRVFNSGRWCVIQLTRAVRASTKFLRFLFRNVEPVPVADGRKAGLGIRPRRCNARLRWKARCADRVPPLGRDPGYTVRTRWRTDVMSGVGTVRRTMRGCSNGWARRSTSARQGSTAEPFGRGTERAATKSHQQVATARKTRRSGCRRRGAIAGHDHCGASPSPLTDTCHSAHSTCRESWRVTSSRSQPSAAISSVCAGQSGAHQVLPRRHVYPHQPGDLGAARPDRPKAPQRSPSHHHPLPVKAGSRQDECGRRDVAHEAGAAQPSLAGPNSGLQPGIDVCRADRRP